MSRSLPYDDDHGIGLAASMKVVWEERRYGGRQP